MEILTREIFEDVFYEKIYIEITWEIIAENCGYGAG